MKRQVFLWFFLKMGYFHLNRQGFLWFFFKMVGENEQASFCLVLFKIIGDHEQASDCLVLSQNGILGLCRIQLSMRTSSLIISCNREFLDQVHQRHQVKNNFESTSSIFHNDSTHQEIIIPFTHNISCNPQNEVCRTQLSVSLVLIKLQSI